ncbi:MAG: protein BatD, partial [Planctomycetes bacterium]|nr:protein BatD [Planctomycetota bacterium]
MRLACTRIHIAILFFSLLLLFATERAVAAEEVSVHASVEKTEIYMGEPFVLQIEVKNDEHPEEPDMSVVKDFEVRSLGGRTDSNSSITIINGKMTTTTRRGYTFSYQLMPKRSGSPVIPPIKVKAGGKTLTTRPILMKTLKPSESSEIKLRFKLSEEKCYVGQPVILTVTWYLAQDVQNFYFNLPVLTDNRFTIMDLEEKIDPASYASYLRISLQDGEVVAKKSHQNLAGREYLAVSFKKILVPKTPGELTIPGGTISCDVVTGYKGRQSRRPFRSLFDDDFFFGGSREAIIAKVVAPSNEPVLQVKPLPEEGKPAGFNGLIGSYSIDAVANPTEVQVGEPITLTIRVAGSEYMENVVLPPLHQQPALSKDFKIPVEMAPGKVEGKIKTFVQTIRAKHPGVKEIPPVELPFFDVTTGKYGVARSEAIPISVDSTRIFTAMDAEGRVIAGEGSSELETWAAGIAYNYEDSA